jgi:hypothetical protein
MLCCLPRQGQLLPDNYNDMSTEEVRRVPSPCAARRWPGAHSDPVPLQLKSMYDACLLQNSGKLILHGEPSRAGVSTGRVKPDELSRRME